MDKENACVTVRCKSAPAARSPTKSSSSHGSGLANPVEDPAPIDELGDTGASSDCRPVILQPASWGPIRVPGLDGPTHLALRESELIISSTLGHAVHCVPLAEVDAHPHAGQRHHFMYPTGVACDERGRCWVAECNNCKVSLCGLPKQSGSPSSTLDPMGPSAVCPGLIDCCFGDEGSNEGQLRGPDGIALHRPSQRLFVVDQANHRVSAFDLTSTYSAFKFSFGQHGKGDGELSHPRGIACDDGDDVFVCGALSHAKEGSHELALLHSRFHLCALQMPSSLLTIMCMRCGRH